MLCRAFLPRISTGCLSAALQLWSGFAPPSGNPHRLRFESTTVDDYGRQLPLRGWGVPEIFTWSLATAVIGLCYKNSNTKCSRPKDQQKNLCLSLFWDLCAGVNTECFILKSKRMLYCCLLALLPVCSVLNLAELLQHARHPAEIEVLRICSGGLQTAGAWIEQIRSTPDR